MKSTLIDNIFVVKKYVDILNIKNVDILNILMKKKIIIKSIDNNGAIHLALYTSVFISGSSLIIYHNPLISHWIISHLHSG